MSAVNAQPMSATGILVLRHMEMIERLLVKPNKAMKGINFSTNEELKGLIEQRSQLKMYLKAFSGCKITENDDNRISAAVTKKLFELAKEEPIPPMPRIV